MRDAFSSALVQLAKADPSVLLLTGDHGYALFDDFRRECPNQYINAGIAEQNMVGMAAGLARTGFRPFVYGLSAFIPVRVLEQIKLDVAHDQLPVVFIGDGAGFVYSHLGTSHQSTEDIACARAIPHLSIYSPADRYEMKTCMDLAYQSHSAVYLRMGKSDRGDIHRASITTKIGDLLNLHKRAAAEKPISIIATGSMSRIARKIAEQHFSNASVWSAPFIKPINTQQVIDICKESTCVVTLEEHSTYAGLGSIISEIASQHSPVKVLRIGTNDCFSHFCGTYEYLLEEHGLNESSIIQKIDAFIN